MKSAATRILHLAFAPGAVLFILVRTSAVASDGEARVTRIVHEVSLLPAKAKAQPAELNDAVRAGTGVRTGLASRSELTFVDLTIERLGASTVFSFNRAGRRVHLESGSMLLRVPKDSGGATMSTTAVTVGITGTTVILESTRTGRNKLTVLEGGARVSLNKNQDESVYVRGGQMEDVPPGARHLPTPVDVNLSDLMENHPLITDFDPLPSRDLIRATASHPAQQQGGAGGLAIIPRLIGVGLGPIGRGGPARGNPNHDGPRNNNGPNGGAAGAGGKNNVKGNARGKAAAANAQPAGKRPVKKKDADPANVR